MTCNIHYYMFMALGSILLTRYAIQPIQVCYCPRMCQSLLSYGYFYIMENIIIVLISRMLSILSYAQGNTILETYATDRFLFHQKKL